MNEPLDPEVALLSAALDLPAGQRAAYLAEACAQDPALRRQVEGLIEAHERARHFLEAPPADVEFPRAARAPEDSAGAPGDPVDAQGTGPAGAGRYKLLEQIGEGGCGVVYMAEQEAPVRRLVALKVIKPGMDTKEVISRFEAERQALALMDHPNITKVFDAGTTGGAGGAGSRVSNLGSQAPQGRPYFVMELVRGIKITEFCDQNRLSTRERLQLFIQVCQAIQHAHQKGVIHRDIKPSNILVTINDPAGAACPKVIDFGIAKATAGRLTDRTLFTAFQQFIGTPAYMSPEQALMTSLDIDTRSDIYSLGVLLYDLLTGRTPFDQQELLAAGLDAMRRTIGEKEPPRPSSRLGSLDPGTLTTTASLRRTDSPKLIHQLRGDLDWIVMKCIEKDRSRRYETANGLASDIQRHLDHEPVSARPPTRLYRLQKLVRRNKLAFGALGAVGLALLIVAIGSTVAAWHVSGARRAEQSQRREAELANLQLRRTISLLELERAEDLFDAQDAASGVAHLAAMLRRDPANPIAANRLVSALLHRNWVLPAAPMMLHLSPVGLASFSPDGRFVLSADRQSAASVWDAATGRSTAIVRHEDRIHHAGFSPDGARFVTASADGMARLWLAEDGTPAAPALAHAGTVYWAEFSADGRRVLTASADHTAGIWDASNGSLLTVLRGHSSHIILARFSPDGRRVATGGSHGSIRLWNADSGDMLLRVEDRGVPLASLAFSPDGHRLLVACADGVARLWRSGDGRPAGNPMEHREPIDHAAFSPDGRLVLTCSQDNTARVWDAETGVPAGPPLLHEGGVVFGAFSPDSKLVVTTSMDKSARIWEARSGTPFCQPLRQLARIVWADFSPDGRRLVTASYDWLVQVWDVRPRRAAELEIPWEAGFRDAAFSPDGSTLLTASGDGTARLWDARTGQPKGAPIQHSGPVHMAAFSPDGSTFVTASTSRSAHVRDTASGDVIAGPFEHARGLYVALFSPEGQRVVTASADGTARVWDIRTGRPVTPPLAHRDEVRMARFSPDGRLVLTISDDHSARVWDAQTGQPVTDFLLHLDHVKWGEFSPDSAKVVTASTDNTACVWDARTGQRLTPALRQERIIEKATFSPDGRHIATVSIDQTARIWEAATGQAVTPPLRHESPVFVLSYSPDGRRLLTGGSSGARLWDAESGRPITEWMRPGGRLSGACFDPAGQRVALSAQSLRLWHVPPAPTPVPPWFIAFAEAVAGIRLDDRGNANLVPRTELEEAAERLPPEGQGDEYERLARWFLTDPAVRPPTPF